MGAGDQYGYEEPEKFFGKMASRYLTTLEDQKVVAVQEVEGLA